MHACPRQCHMGAWRHCAPQHAQARTLRQAIHARACMRRSLNISAITHHEVFKTISQILATDRQ